MLQSRKQKFRIKKNKIGDEFLLITEPVDNRPAIQEGKQTSQKSAHTSKMSRSNQAPVKNADCHWTSGE